MLVSPLPKRAREAVETAASVQVWKVHASERGLGASAGVDAENGGVAEMVARSLL
jgi:hypothetical protein